MSPKYTNIGNDENYKPRDFYKELAEYGLLDEFLQDRMKDKIQENPEFKEEMLKDMQNYSSENVPELDKLYLEELYQNLSLFNKKASQCLIQKP